MILTKILGIQLSWYHYLSCLQMQKQAYLNQVASLGHTVCEWLRYFKNTQFGEEGICYNPCKRGAWHTV